MARDITIKVGTPKGTPTYQPKFPGDPGDGKYYLGWAEPQTYAQGQSWTGTSPRISVYHTYAGAANPSQTDCQKSITANSIVSHTFKLSQTPAQVLAGNADAAIDSFAAYVISKAPWPFWLCYYHEPEDNWTTTTDKINYRAASRRIVQRFRDAGVTNAAWMPILMAPWTFQAGSGRDWRTWHPDWNGSAWQNDIMMDLCGLDLYCPLIGSSSYSTFDSMMDQTRTKTEAVGVPQWDYVLPEFGMYNVVDPHPNWLTYCTDFKAYMKAHRVKAVNYWNNDPGATNKYNFTSDADPDGQKLAGWQSIVAGASVWTP